MVTHHDSRSYAESSTSAVPVSALSAIGSATLPNEVTRLYRRAIQPSTKSVSEATTNATGRGDPPAGLGHARRRSRDHEDRDQHDPQRR